MVWIGFGFEPLASAEHGKPLLWCMLLGCSDFKFLPTSGFSIKPLKVELLAGEQKATETP